MTYQLAPSTEGRRTDLKHQELILTNKRRIEPEQLLLTNLTRVLQQILSRLNLPISTILLVLSTVYLYKLQRSTPAIQLDDKRAIHDIKPPK